MGFSSEPWNPENWKSVKGPPEAGGRGGEEAWARAFWDCLSFARIKVQPIFKWRLSFFFFNCSFERRWMISVCAQEPNLG